MFSVSAGRNASQVEDNLCHWSFWFWLFHANVALTSFHFNRTYNWPGVLKLLHTPVSYSCTLILSFDQNFCSVGVSYIFISQIVLYLGSNKPVRQQIYSRIKWKYTEWGTRNWQSVMEQSGQKCMSTFSLLGLTRAERPELLLFDSNIQCHSCFS